MQQFWSRGNPRQRKGRGPPIGSWLEYTVLFVQRESSKEKWARKIALASYDFNDTAVVFAFVASFSAGRPYRKRDNTAAETMKSLI
jgi:hypothetical protein